MFSQVLLFGLSLALKKKSKRCWWLALLVSRTGFKSLRRLCLSLKIRRPVFVLFCFVLFEGVQKGLNMGADITGTLPSLGVEL